ncbi:MAG: circularly permuted type 2 ATP-grasp protein [Pseudomonadales bacterium]|nr:circularly permuted type 2 ATP-grasp protein [Pseudomonadales bacterium]
MEFESYPLSAEIYDELLFPDGRPRPQGRLLWRYLRSLAPDALTRIQETVANTFQSEGISFTVYSEEDIVEQIIPIDCIPRVLAASEWEQLRVGLTQRIKALNKFLADIYSDWKIVSDGVIPGDMITGCPQYRVEMRGFSAPGDTWVGVCGTDLVRTNEGFHVLEDNLRVPSGVSYMIANRAAVKNMMRRVFRAHGVEPVEHYGDELKIILAELAGKQDPSLVVLTPGVYNSAFYEHAFLANEMGAELVEGRDLVVRNGHAYMKTTTGLKKVDVIYRRVDDDFLDPLVFRPDSTLGVPGLIGAVRNGDVTIVNAPGTGVADDKAIYTYVPDMIRYYLSEEPLLANVPTYLCRRPEDLEYVLDNAERLVIKMVGESGGYGMLIGSQASRQELDEYLADVRERPEQFVAQPELQLSRAPCVVSGRLQPRHVDLRPFVLTGNSVRIVPGAFCRVALREGSLVVNSSQGGGGKDVWVLKQ